jgi:hypothetical protein
VKEALSLVHNQKVDCGQGFSYEATYFLHYILKCCAYFDFFFFNLFYLLPNQTLLQGLQSFKFINIFSFSSIVYQDSDNKIFKLNTVCVLLLV